MDSPLGQAKAPLQLYNSLSRRIEPFRPTSASVTVFVCGITPYAMTHLGHAFTYAAADVLVCFLLSEISPLEVAGHSPALMPRAHEGHAIVRPLSQLTGVRIALG